MQSKIYVYRITTGVGTMVIWPTVHRVHVGDTVRWVTDGAALSIAFAPGSEGAVQFGQQPGPGTLEGRAAVEGYHNFAVMAWQAEKPPICDVAVLIIDP